MATPDDIRSQYPIPTFYFQVTIGDRDSMAFSEVSGLSIEYDTITYTDGLSWRYGSKHMPGQGKPINLTLKKGIVKGDSYLFNWINAVKLNTVEKRDITISLLNDKHEPTVSWVVTDAFPKKLDAPSFNATANEVAIESLELMASSLRIENKA